jgi:hypothetical protein
MPTLMELQSRLSTRRDGHRSPTHTTESLISDARGQLTPAQTVELKLHGLLERPKAEAGGPHFRPKRPR